MKRLPDDMILKTDQGPFRSVWRGQKTAECRNNDRDFQVGDRILLIEHDGSRWIDPYRSVLIEVTHVLEFFRGLVTDYAMLSFKVLQRRIGHHHHITRCPECSKVSLKE